MNDVLAVLSVYDCLMLIYLLLLFQKYFRFSDFRPYQREVIEKIIEKRDCLVVMATGSGKSLW